MPGRRTSTVMGMVSTLLTFDEFEQLPDKPGKLELLRGELIELPPPEQDHNDIAQLIFIALFDTLRKLRDESPELPLGRAYQETGYKISPNSWLQPGVSLTHPAQKRTNIIRVRRCWPSKSYPSPIPPLTSR